MTTNSCPYSIDLGKASEPNRVELGRKDDAKVHKMFLDHTGEWRWRSEEASCESSLMMGGI